MIFLSFIFKDKKDIINIKMEKISVLKNTEVDDTQKFEDLVQSILDDPDQILHGDIKPEDLIKIQKRLNPYGSVIGDVDTERKEAIAVSCTNLREDYLKRFIMTSLVGFLFQMEKEWDVPAEQRRWIPAHHTDTENRHPKELEPFDPYELVKLNEESLRYSKQAADAQYQTEKLVLEKETIERKLKEEIMKDDDTKDEKAINKHRAEILLYEKKIEKAKISAAGLLYGATYTTTKTGIISERKLAQTLEMIKTYPQLANIISKYPEEKLRPEDRQQIEMPNKVAKDIISGFLKEWFEFDPSIHVRSGTGRKLTLEEIVRPDKKKENKEKSLDPEVVSLDYLRLNAKNLAKTDEEKEILDFVYSTKNTRDAVIALLRDDTYAKKIATIMSDDDTRKRYRELIYPISKESPARTALDHIPPQDTFNRFNYYAEVNFENLRTITEAIYPERIDLDWAIALWKYFEGTKTEIDQQFNEFCDKNQDTVPSSIKLLDFGGWNLLGDFKENRDRMSFYNRRTDVLQKILERHAEDKKMGAELMKQRVRRLKQKEIKELGPDAPGLSMYRQSEAERNPGGTVSAMGAEKVISQVEMRRMERARGDPKAAQELEYLEQEEKIKYDLDQIKLTRPLTQEERYKYKETLENIKKAHEMIEVPDDGIQVDVFNVNAAKGQMDKRSFYTKAEAPEFVDDYRKQQQNQVNDMGGSTHPANISQAARMRRQEMIDPTKTRVEEEVFTIPGGLKSGETLQEAMKRKNIIEKKIIKKETPDDD